MTAPRIGLALSGGGFRAVAFGLGCMRALQDRGVLDQVTVVSGVSGGSVLAALWAYGPRAFDEFDAAACDLLRTDMQARVARAALAPAVPGRGTARAALSLLPGPARTARTATRTDALRAVLDTTCLRGKAMPDVNRPGLATVINATDLLTTNAVRFGSHRSSCSRWGDIQQPVAVTEAVAASAAFPPGFPALEREYDFALPGRPPARHKVAMTDGGVYDNLGVTALEPGRSRSHTGHVYDLDYVVACDSGAGLPDPRPAPRLWGGRMLRSFEATYRRTQDGGRGRLHQAAADGSLKGFVLPYLGMDDGKLPMPVADLVPRERVRDHPTDLRAMNGDDLAAIAGRGEQLTRALVAHYCPEL